jgi:thymidylate kinase
LSDTLQGHDVLAPGTGPDGVPRTHPTLAGAFEALDRAGVRWALLRGADDLVLPSGDVDVLVDRAALPSLDGILTAAGLQRLGVRGHGRHRFYFAHDPAHDLWLKLDVVTGIDFGRFQELRTPLAEGCLDRRVRVGDLWRLAAEDEAWLFLLHQLLDKGRIAADRLAPARAAAERAVPTAAAAAVLDQRAGPGSARQVLDAVEDSGSGTTARSLYRRWVRRRPVPVAARYVVTRVVRRLAVPVPGQPPGLVIAVVGPDGAGKTTLTDAIGAAFPVTTRSVYMGLWREGRWDRQLHRLPAGWLIHRTARVLRTSAVAHVHRMRGRLVVLDRFAQDVLLPGSEAPGTGGRILSTLALRLNPRPDLVLVLDAPGAVMFARKGEHSAEVLEERRQGYLALAAHFPDSVVLDAARPADEVRAAALTAIWRRYGGRP